MIGLKRGTRPVPGSGIAKPLEAGDTLLVIGSWRAIRRLAHERRDLVLLDLVMPGMSGVDLFAELRRLHPDLRILLMSGYNLHGARADGLLASGAAGFLQKPFRSDDLAAAVARALATGA